MTEQFENQEWGERITTTGGRNMSDVEEAIREMQEMHEKLTADILGENHPRPQKWIWKDRFTLAWAVLRGRITWSDIY